MTVKYRGQQKIELLKYPAWAICDEPNTNFTAFDSHLLVHYNKLRGKGIYSYVLIRMLDGASAFPCKVVLHHKF